MLGMYVFYVCCYVYMYVIVCMYVCKWNVISVI